MATPVFVCGAECGVVAAASHWITSTGTTSFSTTTVRTGARSLRVNPTAGTGEFDTLALASSADWVVRAYVYFATLPSATTSFISRVGTVIGVWFNASDSKVYVGSDASTLGATGVSVTTGQWYRIDFKYTATTLDAQVDGAAVGQLTGTYSAFTQLAIGRSATVTKDLFFDDIIISQTAVDYPLGAGFVKSYIPNADGTHNVAGANDFERTLTGTDITNATTDAYTLIDERPLPTTAVDFINGVAPPNATDYVEWQYEDSTESSAPRGVEAVIVHHDASGAGTNNFTVTLRESAGGTSGNIWSGTTNVGATITYKRAFFDGPRHCRRLDDDEVQRAAIALPRLRCLTRPVHRRGDAGGRVPRGWRAGHRHPWYRRTGDGNLRAGHRSRDHPRNGCPNTRYVRPDRSRIGSSDGHA